MVKLTRYYILEKQPQWKEYQLMHTLVHNTFLVDDAVCDSLWIARKYLKPIKLARKESKFRIIKKEVKLRSSLPK